ncbi:hypothetical protein AJ78_02396 [Emergomyces pasteurianus Ep9510]|uniref:Uncharacterized protein n=1 Tax=Emergomyces pasteurianus Ep9510 TaxID=1447872 RepID=A0A1J9QMY1_9EURO|nr:hypothetical protein AJ78_02396 [Emergomyces pasteurianus Ep9510]
MEKTTTQGASHEKGKEPEKGGKGSSPEAPATKTPPSPRLNEESLRRHLEQTPEKYDSMQRYLDQSPKEDVFSVFTLQAKSSSNKL